MPQDRETGRKGAEKGYSNADVIGALIRAERIGKNSNEFLWGDRRVVIKSGPSAVVTEATLSRVDAVIFGEQQGGGWVVYEVDPQTYQQASVASKSPSHDDSYRQVSKVQIRQIGRQVEPASGGSDA